MTTQTHPRLLVVGALHVDEVATIDGTLVPRASNRASWQRLMGGVATNAARAAQRVFDAAGGGSVTLHAALGDDVDGQSLKSSLESCGLQLAPQYIDGSSTGRYTAVMSESGELILGLADVQLAEQLSASAVVPGMESGDFSTLLIDANLCQDCLNQLIESANMHNLPVVALSVSPEKTLRLLPIARYIRLLFCNRREALAMVQATDRLPVRPSDSQWSVQHLAKRLSELGFSDIVLTDGDADVLISQAGLQTTLPTLDVAMTRNVNGAGDTLAGASLAAILMGENLKGAVENTGLTMASQVLSGEWSSPSA